MADFAGMAADWEVEAAVHQKRSSFLTGFEREMAVNAAQHARAEAVIADVHDIWNRADETGGTA